MSDAPGMTGPRIEAVTFLAGGQLPRALIEEVDIEDIQHAIDETYQDEIVSAYQSLLCGSRNHLRAFVYQVESNGGVFETQIFTDEEGQELIESIIESPIERDCGSY